MNNLSLKSLIGALLLPLITSCTQQRQTNEGGVQAFDLKEIASHYSDETFITDSKIFEEQVLKISPADGHNGIVIWEKGNKQNWNKGHFLVFEIYGNNDFSGVINIEFYKEIKDSVSEKIVLQSGEISGNDKESPWISSLMGILPRLKTKVVFPLGFLDAQTLFIPRSPRQLKGTISGNRLDPNDIIKVVLRFGPYFVPNFLPEYEIASISINNSIPEPYLAIDKPVIDKLGQWKEKEWKGKIKNEKELMAQNLKMEKMAEVATMPDNWSQYGGWKGKRFNATGYFNTQHDGKRWWLVDPDGYAFLSTGIDCIRHDSPGFIDGIEDLFEWLPTEKDTLFADAITNYRDRKTMDFYIANLIRIYGNDWKDKWKHLTTGLMKKFRLNTVGNWSDIDFAKTSGIPYVLPLQEFPGTKILLYRDFPDVFSDEYLENSERFAKQLVDYRDDPFLIGYFLRNEPNWAFGYHNLAYEMFGTNQQSITKDEFIKWLKDRYQQDINALNRDWILNLKSFEDIKSLTFKDYPSTIANKDFYDFSTIMVKRYVDVPCDEVKKIDKNHLNLGMRYAWLSSDLLYKAGERFDVFSINGYGINPPPTEEIAKISGKPVMIGEFHHGSVDRALPATGIIGVLNQEDRAAAFRNYIEQGFARPELIGMHYFQWIDQPYYGRFDGENYNIGVVTIGNLPYEELTNAMTITNERIYQVATGAVKPFKAEITAIPPIHY
jgi:SLT domain-containing protein